MIPEFCSHCGRRLVLVDEPDGFDRLTGKPKTEAWAYCPKWPKHVWQLIYRSQQHTATNINNPLIGRVWR